MNKLTDIEKQAVKKFHKELTMPTELKHSITKKEIFQLVWCEYNSTKFKSSFLPQWHTEQHFNSFGTLSKAKSFDYIEMNQYLEWDERACRKAGHSGGYYKHKIALFDPETKEFMFSIRYDLGDRPKDSLEGAMFYGNGLHPKLKFHLGG